MSETIAPIDPTEKALRSIERLEERFKTAPPESLKALAGSEAGIGDIYMNLNRQLADGLVEEKLKLLIAAGVASAVGGREATAFFRAAALEAGATSQEAIDAVGVAAVCSVFNGHYRFRHQVPDDLEETFTKFRAPFNANIFMKSSLDTKTVEAICIAVSSINDCEICVSGHIRKGMQSGLTAEQIDEVIRAASVAAALARVAASLA